MTSICVFGLHGASDQTQASYMLGSALFKVLNLQPCTSVSLLCPMVTNLTKSELNQL